MTGAPQMQTPGGNQASADNQDNTPIIDDDKVFRTLQAEFARTGHALIRTNPSDGPVSYYAGRWNQVQHLPTLDHARALLAQIGGPA